MHLTASIQLLLAALAVALSSASPLAAPASGGVELILPVVLSRNAAFGTIARTTESEGAMVILTPLADGLVADLRLPRYA